MKRIEALIRPDAVSEVCTALDDAGHAGVTLTPVDEQGVREGWVNHVRGLSRTVNVQSKVRLEVVVPDDDVEMTIKTLRDAVVDNVAGGDRIFIHHMDDALLIC